MDTSPVSYTHLDVYKRQLPVPVFKTYVSAGRTSQLVISTEFNISIRSTKTDMRQYPAANPGPPEYLTFIWQANALQRNGN